MPNMPAVSEETIGRLVAEISRSTQIVENLREDVRELRSEVKEKWTAQHEDIQKLSGEVEQLKKIIGTSPDPARNVEGSGMLLSISKLFRWRLIIMTLLGTMGVGAGSQTIASLLGLG